jgi:formylglycine-generating enzyme required for sulfatase activity
MVMLAGSAATILAVFYWLGTASSISRSNAAKIRNGMSLQEVEFILGGPERDEITRAVIPDEVDPVAAHEHRQHELFESFRDVGTHNERTWQSNEVIVRVGFDMNDHVRYCLIDPVRPKNLATGLVAQAQDKKDPPKYDTSSIGMKFVWIPPGTFIMGSPNEEKERYEAELQHKVTLTRGFYMGIYTVTQEEWKEIMGNSPSRHKGEKKLPVESIDWEDCQEFIKKLRAKDKKLYRLPTEAEWEYSCRAGTATPFHSGNTISTEQANYNGDYTYGNGKKGVFRKKTMPVGSFPANAFGLYDMHGNVGQWCQDRYGDYPHEDVINPQGPNAGNARVVRGGGFVCVAQDCRSARRIGIGGLHASDMGFRVCFFAE